jgi:hypothetical protein
MPGTAAKARFTCGCGGRADIIVSELALTLITGLPNGLQESVKLFFESWQGKPDIADNSLADSSLE